MRLPVLVPLTGFVALEGTSQRNGALLAASQIRDVAFKPEVLDTPSTPEAAVTAWDARGRPATTARRHRADPRHADAGAAAARPGARRAAAHHLRHRTAGRDGQSVVLPLLPERRHGEGGACALRRGEARRQAAGRDLPEHRLRPVGPRAAAKTLRRARGRRRCSRKASRPPSTISRLRCCAPRPPTPT